MISVLRWFYEKRLRAIQHDQDSPLAYLRQMLRVSPPHFFTFIKIMPLARFRRALPPEAYHLVRIVTARHEHGGTCLPMEIRLAQRAGVRLPLLHAVLGESPCTLPPELAEVYFFAETVARGSGEEDHWREAIMRRYGEVGIIELAQAISITRLFSTVMHVMGCAAPGASHHRQDGAPDC
ncbi:MAG: hypothetical protein ABS70_00160 [Nitrospira sp. SCN 59-13]|nr:MAG: hypothetical protein ABS70_00160 [Nitrospira sp. SCN 59-13]